MKPVIQRVIGIEGEGDCLMAAAASILEIPLDDLPKITRENEEHWFRIFSESMLERGFRILEMANDPPVAPHGYAIAIGLSPRGSAVENHAVVALNGNVVHDPHPTRTGVAKIDYWLILVPLARQPALNSPTVQAAELEL